MTDALLLDVVLVLALVLYVAGMWRAGIVAGSDPEAEMLETRVKFRPIIDALA